MERAAAFVLGAPAAAAAVPRDALAAATAALQRPIFAESGHGDDAVRVLAALAATLAAITAGETAESILHTAAVDMMDALGVPVTGAMTTTNIALLDVAVLRRLFEHLASEAYAALLLLRPRPATSTADRARHALRALLPDASVVALEDARLVEQVDAAIRAFPEGAIPARLVPDAKLAALTPAQLEALEGINAAMAAEYTVRRQMLLKRLEVTVQSFGWDEDAGVVAGLAAAAAAAVAPAKDAAMETDASDAAPKRSQRLAAKYAAMREPLADSVRFALVDLRAARADLVAQANASVASSRRAATSVRRILLGAVPDRGGRVTAAAKVAANAAKAAAPREADGARPANFRGRGGPPRGGPARGGPARGGQRGGNSSGSRGGNNGGNNGGNSNARGANNNAGGGSQRGGGGGQRGGGGGGGPSQRGGAASTASSSGSDAKRPKTAD